MSTPAPTTPRPTYLRAATNGDLTGTRGRRAVVGPRARRGAGARAGRAPASGSPTGGSGPTRSRSCRTASPRTAPPPCRSPTSTAAVTPATTAATRSSTADALRGAVHRLDAEGFQVHVHCIGDRAVRETLDAFEGLDPRPRPAAPHRAPAAGPPRGRRAVRGARRGRQHAGALGLPRRPDDRSDPAVPRARARPLAVPLRGPGPGRRPARLRQRLAGEHARPARRDPCRGEPLGLRRGGPGRVRAVPAGAGARPPRSRSRRTRRAPRGSTTATTPGVLRDGAVADLAVLDRDPFAGPAEEIGAARVVSTWVDGRPVFEATS